MIVAAKTGSGKTMTYVLPILSNLLYAYENGELPDRIQSLVLVPTRELALQVFQQFKKMVNNENLKQIRSTLIIGGLSKEKQLRIMKKKPHIIISTAGRLWDLIDQDDIPYLKYLPGIRYLVLDEADRMIELGQFKEIGKVLSFIYKDCLDKQTKFNEVISGASKKKSIAYDKFEDPDLDKYPELDEPEGKKNNKEEEGGEFEEELGGDFEFDEEILQDDGEDFDDEEFDQDEEEVEMDEEEIDQDEEEADQDEEEADQDEEEADQDEEEGRKEHSVEFDDNFDDTDLGNVKYMDSEKAFESMIVLSSKEIEDLRKDAKKRRTFVVSATIGHSFMTSRIMNKHVKKVTKKKLKTDENYNPKIAEIMEKLTFNFKAKTID